MELANHPRKLISKLYRLITSSNPTISLPKEKWNNDLTLPSDPDLWTQICGNIFNMTTNTNLQLIQYKTIHRTHITQSKLFKMRLSDTDTCSQCTSGNTDTYLHATWFCQPVHSLWTTVTNTLSSILDCRVPLSPKLWLIIGLDLLVHCDIPDSLNGAYLHGDVNCAILSSIHSKVIDLHKRTRPEPFICSDFNSNMFVQSLAALHTIEEINNASFLPGIKFGYVVCDPCSSPTKALHCLEHLLAINGSLPVLSDYSDFRPSVKALFGEGYSELSIAVAKLLGLYLFPQISCTSSSPVLSDKLRYPSFMRVIPSDVHQAKALIKLMTSFSWDLVGMVYGDDDYGRAAHQSLLQEAKGKVCFAFEKEVTHYLDHVDVDKQVKDAVDTIRASSAQVVLLILKPQLVEKIFKWMIQTNTNRIWIASDVWSMFGPLTKMPDINKVGDIFGFSFTMGNIPGFEDYLKNLRPTPGARNDFIEEYKELRLNCSISPLNCSVDELGVVDLREVYSQRVAVYAVAHGLKKLLKCNETTCNGDINFPPWQLMESIRSVNFTLDGTTHYFDENGDFTDGYDLIRWKKTDVGRIIEVVGKFLLNKGEVELLNELQELTSSVQVQFKCLESCGPGSSKSVTNNSCCISCIVCLEGTYTDKYDESSCHKCPEEQHSLENATECKPFIEKYLFWSEAYPIVLLVAAAIGIILVFTSFIICLTNRETPVNRMANVKLSCFMLLGLMVSFIDVIIFIGKPNKRLCQAQQAVYGLGFTLCVSSILVKAYHTFVTFMPLNPSTQHHLEKLNKPLINLFMLTVGQGVILNFWLILDSPDVQREYPGSGMVKYVICNEGSIAGFAVMHVYIALLALICFLLAFMVRRVPQDFNDTGPIIFSMLIHLFAWLGFIPIYINKNQTEQKHIVQASAVLASSYGIILCHFVPKCFIVLCDLSGNSNSSRRGRLGRHVGHHTERADNIVLPEQGHITPTSGIITQGVEEDSAESVQTVSTLSSNDTTSAVHNVGSSEEDRDGAINSTQNRKRHTNT
ncbi:G-protein coupled receptor family C group 6 member A-like [Paramisgurnus dabryanus]|uniref:G-protein coupled receptor family C group 6 member A-like n=1 Tax=Paramisgurnus dabryanus TaxID=90735 RepID=UPI003CCF3CF8